MNIKNFKIHYNLEFKRQSPTNLNGYNEQPSPTFYIYYYLFILSFIFNRRHAKVKHDNRIS